MRVVSKAEMPTLVGEETGVSDWFSVEQDRINQFADVTGDHQFIHLDKERATPIFGSTIAHGFLSLSLLPHLSAQTSFVVEGTTMAVNYGLDRVRFLSPVLSGSRVRLRSKLVSVQEKKPGQFLLKSENRLEIEGGEAPALIAESLTLLYIDS